MSDYGDGFWPPPHATTLQGSGFGPVDKQAALNVGNGDGVVPNEVVLYEVQKSGITRHAEAAVEVACTVDGDEFTTIKVRSISMN